jgi:phage baseplate assembly protein W
MATYNGFNTIGNIQKFKLTDFELVKRDIQNHFSIRRGEKLMNPEFGTIIWDMLFEPLSDETKNTIIQDVKKIIANDPRVAAKNVLVTQFDRGIQLEIELIYIATNQIGSIITKFDQSNAAAGGATL